MRLVRQLRKAIPLCIVAGGNMNGCYIYVLNAPNGTCHKFDYWGEFELGSVEKFLEGKGFRLKDIDWLTSDEEVIHDASLPGEVIHDT